MMVDLNELQLFAQLGKAQSFTLAARQLGTQKSAVSRALVSLETRLGVRLVERTTRRVALTEAGELFLEKCLRVLEEAEQADLAINMMHSKPKGRLRVGAPAAFVRFVLAPLLGDFLRKYPEVKLSLQIIQGPPLPNETGLDIAIRQGPLDDSAMRVMSLKKISLGLYASPGYVATNGAPETPASLRNHRFIITNCGSHGEPVEFAKLSLRRGALSETIRVEAHMRRFFAGLNLVQDSMVHQQAIHFVDMEALWIEFPKSGHSLNAKLGCVKRIAIIHDNFDALDSLLTVGMLTIGKPLSISVPLSISNLSTAALIPCSGEKMTLTLRPGTAAAASLRKTSIVLIS